VARRQTGYAALTADADGVITALSADVGQVVAAGQPVMRLAHDGAREAVVDTPEARRGSLPRQARAVLLARSDAAPMTATLRQVAAAADPQTRTFEARYVLEGSAAEAPLGTSVRIDVPRPAAGASGVLVPLGALVDRERGPAVYVVDPAHRTVHRRSVTVASLAEETARVTAGLQPGEVIVALGAVGSRDVAVVDDVDVIGEVEIIRERVGRVARESRANGLRRRSARTGRDGGFVGRDAHERHVAALCFRK